MCKDKTELWDDWLPLLPPPSRNPLLEGDEPQLSSLLARSLLGLMALENSADLRFKPFLLNIFKWG